MTKDNFDKDNVYIGSTYIFEQYDHNPHGPAYNFKKAIRMSREMF